MGGRGRFIYNLAKKQAEKGHRVFLVSALGSYIPGCKIFSISDVPNVGNIFPINIIRRRVAEFSHAFHSYSFVDTDFDIVHNHIEWEGGALSRITRTPVLTTIHGSLNQNLRGNLYSTICNIPSSSKYVTYSKTTFDTLRNIYRKKLLSHIYPGIDTRKFIFRRKVDSDILKLCCVGRLSPEKGFHTAIKLANRISKRGYPLRLDLLGAIDPLSKEYAQQIILEAKKRKFISLQINASTDAVIKTLQDSDATLMPIEWEETFGFVAAESLACGTPVVAYNRGSLNEIITHGVTGFLCDTFDELIGSIINALELNRNSCSQIIKEKFSLEKMYEKYMNIYNKISPVDI